MIYVVIDTNVFVSALFTSNTGAVTFRVLDAVLRGKIVPLYNTDIFDEYVEVLNRPKFHFSKTLVQQFLGTIRKKGISSSRIKSTEAFPDPKDVVFYEVALSKEDAYLVTGNTKHFPHSPIVVTPAEMMAILDNEDFY